MTKPKRRPMTSLGNETITKNGQPIVFSYTAAQEKIFLKSTAQYTLVPKGRRAGVTYGAMLYCIEALLDGKQILWVDTIQANLDVLYRRYFQPILLKIKPEYYQYRVQMHDLSLLNGNIYFRSAEKPENIEGFSYDIIILNEAGIILKGQRGRDLWFNSIYPMVMDYAARVFFIGTPKGRKARRAELSDSGYSLYYELCCKAGLDKRDPDKDWTCMSGFTAHDNPFLNAEAREAFISDVPAYIRDQEVSGLFVDCAEVKVIDREWIKIVDTLPEPYLQRAAIISLDTAFKTEDWNDCSAGIFIVKDVHGNYYVADCFNERLDFPSLQARVKDFTKTHDCNNLLIEDRASGQSLIQTLRLEGYRVTAYLSTKDKLTRAALASKVMDQGKFFLLRGKWNDMVIDQLTTFSGLEDAADDIVDAITQVILHMETAVTSFRNPVIRRVVRTSPALARY